MRQTIRTLALVLALLGFTGQTQNASAAPVITISAFGDEKHSTASDHPSFVLTFKQVNASSCLNVLASIDGDLTVVWRIPGQLESIAAPTSLKYDFTVSNVSLSTTSLDCKFTANWSPYYAPDTQSATEVDLILLLNKMQIASVSGTLVNSTYTGVLEIVSPSRGDQIFGWTTVKFDYTMQVTEIAVRICQTSCDYNDRSISFYPSIKYSERGDGFVGASSAKSVDIFFSSTGIYEVEIRLYGAKRLQKSVFVNVNSSMREASIPWNVVERMINSPTSSQSQFIYNPVEPTLTCGNLYWNKTNSCRVSFGNNINTRVPVKVLTSSKGAPFKTIRTSDLSSLGTSVVTFPVPILNRSDTFVLKLVIPNLTVESSETTSDWGAPPSAQVQFPQYITSGKMFTIKVVANRKANGTCTLSENGVNRVANVRIINGSGVAKTTLVWNAPAGSSNYLNIIGYCTLGNSNFSTFNRVVGLH